MGIGPRGRGACTACFSDKAPPELQAETKFEEAEERLASVESQRRVVEQSLKRPASGEVNADAAGSLADAGYEVVASINIVVASINIKDALALLVRERFDAVIIGHRFHAEEKYVLAVEACRGMPACSRLYLRSSPRPPSAGPQRDAFVSVITEPSLMFW